MVNIEVDGRSLYSSSPLVKEALLRGSCPILFQGGLTFHRNTRRREKGGNGLGH